MKETKGNLWDVEGDAFVIATNGVVKANGTNVMGRGIAKEAADLFPQVPMRLGSLISNFGNHVHVIQESPFTLVSFPTKHDWRMPSDIRLIARSAHELAVMANDEEWDNVILPRVGCGAGQLTWDPDVKALLSSILDDRFIVATL